MKIEDAPRENLWVFETQPIYLSLVLVEKRSNPNRLKAYKKGS